MNQHWIGHPTILTGEHVQLVPLAAEHFEELYKAASDKKLWELIPTDCSERENFDKAYLFALSERDKGHQYPFVIVHKATNELIGSTRFFEIYPGDKKLEIGWTWIITRYWGTEINLECKLLMLTFCFEHLQTRRVQFKTDETNIRSRKAIEKLGARFEGVLRKDRIKANGVSRSAAYYSILDDEWEEAREKIKEQILYIRQATL
ncbi:MAG: GNAT family N-acetyltransferase [Bacteroidota bacterium]|nr:GNAT family N-acetyltransferase [Bacteroidota bacterium]